MMKMIRPLVSVKLWTKHRSLWSREDAPNNLGESLASAAENVNLSDAFHVRQGKLEVDNGRLERWPSD